MIRFLQLFLFERKSCKKKQKTQRRFIALYFVGLIMVRAPARACSHEHVVRPLVWGLRDASLVGRRKSI